MQAKLEWGWHSKNIYNYFILLKLEVLTMSHFQMILPRVNKYASLDEVIVLQSFRSIC